jgi:hypothetical protein
MWRLVLVVPEEELGMAQKIIREFVDDIDGSPAERTFSFAVDGVSYEIDLSTQNIA